MAILGSALAAPQAHAQTQTWEPPAESPWTDAGIGMACVLTSIFYTPAKVLYAGFGALTGGAAYVLTGGQKEVLSAVLNPALRGDYVVTPAHLKREKPLIFVGLDAESVEQERERVGVGSYPEDPDRYPERYPERYPDPEPNPF